LRAARDHELLVSIERGKAMPRLIVTAETGTDRSDTVVHDERVLASNLESDHSSSQLIERVGWALQDAEELEADRA
jgi:hypothetical protein